MSDLYDVKITVRSTVKLLLEIKGLLLMKPNRERLFRDTTFGSWLDIQSYENDSDMMHYVLQHQVCVSNIRFDYPLIIFHIGDHWLEFGRKEFCLITGFRFGQDSEKHVLRDKNTWLNMWDEDAVRLCLLIASELVFMGKEKRDFLTKHIMWLVDDFDAWNDYPCNTQPKPKVSSLKPYQPSQARNEYVNDISTRSGKSYDPPVNLNDQRNDGDGDDEDDEPTPQPKPKNLKPVKEILTVKVLYLTDL
nr:phospholipase-like protein [Tanacetum cinerariifolium]